ncbi:MAG: uroporphyrinogen decarboxylase family protein [Actinomycetota bacterium]|nr:uroporphyrinogen decarboxylase family protein [Actinomycetota bacterium]
MRVSNPLDIRLTIHDNCMSRDFPTMMDGARELASSLGADMMEMERTRERTPCCCSGGGSRSFSLPDMISQMISSLGEAEASGAEGLAVYCTGCLWALSMARTLTGSDLPVYHVFELVRIANGEDDLQARHLERAWQIVGAMGDGVLDYLMGGERRLFLDNVPLGGEKNLARDPRPFSNTSIPSLLDRPDARDLIGRLSAGTVPAFAAFYLGGARLLFSARVRLGGLAGNLLSSAPARALEKAVPAPADTIYRAGTGENNRFMGVLKKTVLNRIPLRYITRLGGRLIISFPCAAPVNKYLGRTFEEATWNPQVNFDTVNRMVEMFDSDMLLGVIDGSIEPQACGCEVDYPEIGVPCVTTHPAVPIEELEKLSVPDPSRDGWLPQMTEAMRPISGKYKITCASAVGGPTTITCELGGPRTSLRASSPTPLTSPGCWSTLRGGHNDDEGLRGGRRRRHTGGRTHRQHALQEARLGVHGEIPEGDHRRLPGTGGPAYLWQRQPPPGAHGARRAGRHRPGQGGPALACPQDTSGYRHCRKHRSHIRPGGGKSRERTARGRGAVRQNEPRPLLYLCPRTATYRRIRLWRACPP